MSPGDVVRWTAAIAGCVVLIALAVLIVAGVVRELSKGDDT